MTEGQQLGDLRTLPSYGAGTYSDIGGRRHHQKDVHTLAQLGKKQVLKVCYSISVLFGIGRRSKLLAN